MNLSNIRKEIFERDNHKCAYCGIELSISESIIEHIIPKSMGGKTTIDNLVLSCGYCNRKISARTPKEILSEMIIENSQYHQTYLNNISNIEQLLNLEIQDIKAREGLNKMLFSNVITTLETYLSDAFINTTINDPLLIKNLVETDPEFKKRKINLSEVFTTHDSIKDIIEDYLLDIIYHNIYKVKNLYEYTLNVSFPEDLEDIQKAIIIRHDIVHRNGKSKQGTEISIDKDVITECIALVNSFIKHIDNQIKLINKFADNPVIKKSLTT